MRNAFSKNGGSMAEPGAVAWQFERKGVLLMERSADEDELMLAAAEAGAEDVSDLGDSWQVTCAPSTLGEVRESLEGAGYKVSSAELTMVPNTMIPLNEEAEARKVLRVVDALEDMDDVQNVYANFDIPDAILELVEA